MITSPRNSIRFIRFQTEITVFTFVARHFVLFSHNLVTYARKSYPFIKDTLMSFVREYELSLQKNEPKCILTICFL